MQQYTAFLEDFSGPEIKKKVTISSIFMNQGSIMHLNAMSKF